MIRTPPVYRALVRFGHAAIPLIARGNGKLARGDRERRAALARWETWGRTGRDRSRSLVWFHAPSVGEGLQAEAVLERLRGRHPEWQLVYSFFSPSAERLAKRLLVDHADFLPWDLPATVDAMLDALAPDALVFTKVDLWPELAARAGGRGIPVALVAATVSPVSGRLRWPAALTRAGYGAVAAAGAIAPADARRLESLGVPADRIEITGDPRMDSAAARAAPARPGGPPTLVAGSTWPGDERVLLAAFRDVRRRHPEARLVLVPHEPRPAHLERVRGAARRLGLPPPRAPGDGEAEASFVLEDRVGVLVDRYAGGIIGYVGGGFGRRGLHAVLEPAAAGLPVITGPRWQSSRDAELLLAARAAVALPARGAAAALAAAWSGWLADQDACREAGARARAVVDAGLGAAERNAALVERLVAGRRPAQRPTMMPS